MVSNTPPPALDPASLVAATPTPSGGFWDKVSDWAAKNKALVYSIAGVAVVITGAGAVYYLRNGGEAASATGTAAAQSAAKKRKSKSQRRKEKKKADESKKEEKTEEVKKDDLEGIPEITEESVKSLDAQTRSSYAAKLKAAGNKFFGSKDYNRAIELYSKAILCRPDPVYYSNRAACHNALGDWEKVIADTSSAIEMDQEYVKAINRRANAYEANGQYREALLDFTASCIIEGFAKEPAKIAVERLLKKIAEEKGREILAKKGKELPSPTFVTNYLQSFRSKPLPAGLSAELDLDDESGKGLLRKGLIALERRTSDAYDEARASFEKALEVGGLDEFESLALDMRATFTYLMGDTTKALEDLEKAVTLDPTQTQSYIKRASLHLELGNRESAIDDFDLAITQNKDDPDIYYHRAQLHFILSELAEAAKDYQKSIDLDPDFIYSHIQLGVTQYKMGSIASAMATFRRSLKNFENVSDVHNYYGELLLDQQKYAESIEKFEKAVDLEKQNRPWGVNVLPLINKALALFQWKHDFKEAEELCQKALIIDPECDIAVATLAQLLLQEGKVPEALTYFERASEMARTEAEVVNAISYAEATRAQLEVRNRFPKLAAKLAAMGAAAGGGFPM
ncbi:TOM (translocase of outer membrane) complex component [Ascosphaera aggregata]|nr:TOM (translocase of outer membrane) complex component [Ascosphaera aggregata]